MSESESGQSEVDVVTEIHKIDSSPVSSRIDGISTCEWRFEHIMSYLTDFETHWKPIIALLPVLAQAGVDILLSHTDQYYKSTCSTALPKDWPV